MKRESNDFICTAYHEAGHAVAAYFLDIKFNYVTVR